MTNTCPCCGYTTTKHLAAWECRRCGEARDFEEWFNDLYEEVTDCDHLDYVI